MARRGVEVTTDVVRLGRGADCEVYLADPRVALLHAEIHGRAGGLYVETVAPSLTLMVNDALGQTARIQVGDTIKLGPYEINVVDAPEGKDLALTVELVRPLGDDLAELKARSRTRIGAMGLSKRAWAWLLVAVTLLVFVAAPLYAFLGKPEQERLAYEPGKKAERSLLSEADTLWLSGAISGPHRYFAADCEACHQLPFVQVRDAACLKCHEGIENHADPVTFATARFEGKKCQSCHKEHTGVEHVVLREQPFCSACHANLDQREPETSLRNASDFGSDHPQFRPRVVVDPAGPTFTRVAIDSDPKPKENSNLKFPHAKHLSEKGVRHPEKGTIKLACADCHKPEPGGVGMLPITMEVHCIACHRLSFEPNAPKRVLPHGKPNEAVEQLRDFYAKVALEGGFEDPEAPPSVRRRPGTPLTPDARQEALGWARSKAEQVTTTSFGKTLCGSCHNVTSPLETGRDSWQVAPVLVVDRWLPKGKFDHGKHEAMACVACHDAPKSENSQDVLLPGVANCQACHGGESAEDRVPSTCITCHEFHIPGRPAMTASDQRTTAAAP